MTKKVILLVGVPASGKTTLLEKVPNATVISTDNLIEDAAEACGKTYDECFATEIDKATKQAQTDFRAALNRGDEKIIIDRTNLSPKARRPWIAAAVNKGYKVEAIVFNLPRLSEEIDEWRRRLRNRPGKTIPSHILESMKKNFTTPTAAEGFSAFTYVDSWK